MEKQITTKNQMKKLKIRLNSRIKNSFNGLKSRLDAEEKMIYESLFYVHYLTAWTDILQTKTHTNIQRIRIGGTVSEIKRNRFSKV